MQLSSEMFLYISTERIAICKLTADSVIFSSEIHRYVPFQVKRKLEFAL